MKKYVKLAVVILCCVIMTLMLTGCGQYPTDLVESEAKTQIISFLENCFGKEGNFKIVEIEKYERKRHSVFTTTHEYWRATVTTSYFEGTFEYDMFEGFDVKFAASEGDSSVQFLNALFKNKYGVGIYEYLESDKNAHFSSNKREIENMLNSINKPYELEYTVEKLTNSDFDNFGKLPSLEDVNNKTKHRASISFINATFDCESILKDMKQICSFYDQKSFLTMSMVRYCINDASWWNGNVLIDKDSREISILILSDKPRERHIYEYDNNFNFTFKEIEYID